MALRQLGLFQHDNDGALVLPEDLVLEILSHYTLEELLRPDAFANSILLTSRAFARIGNDDGLWKRLFKKCYGVDITGPSCREKFRLAYVCEAAVRQPNEQLIAQAYENLCRHITQNKCDSLWTNHLHGLFLLTKPTICFSFINGAPLLYQAATQGNPCAMVQFFYLFPNTNMEGPCFLSELPVGVSLDAKKLEFLSRAHAMGYREGTLALANYYLRQSEKDQNNEFRNNYFELVLQAAKNGLAEAMCTMAGCYLPDPTCATYIPFGDMEWASFALIRKMDAMIEKSEFTQESFDEYLAVLKTNAQQGCVFATMELHLLAEGKRQNELSQLRIQIEPRLVSAAFFTANAFMASPARAERFHYWLDQAVKSGMKENSSRLEILRTDLRDQLESLKRMNAESDSDSDRDESFSPSSSL